MSAARWFGIGLGAGLLFLWCLMSQAQAEAVQSGWMWGIVVFGLACLAALALAALRFWGGGAPERRDPLLRASGLDPLRRGGAGSDPFRETQGSHDMGSGDMPRRAAGRTVR